MSADYNPFSAETLAQVRAKQARAKPQFDGGEAQNSDQKTPPPPSKKEAPRAKERKIEFLKLDLAPLSRLAHRDAPGTAWKMFCALSEAWFGTGICMRHLNPFPLSIVNTQKWSLSRMQKSRALRFLAQNRFIAIDRREPENPLVTLLWLPPEP
jgi:hypothetical protein